MFGSDMLNVVIGLVFVYLLLSVICSGINELLASVMSLRSKNLEKGIRNLLSDPNGSGTAQQFFQLPLVKSLGRRVTSSTRHLPSYIPSRTFSLALFNLLFPENEDKGSKTIQDVRQAINNLDADPDLKNNLLSFVNNAQDDLDKFRTSIETWYDDAMDRVSGWYKRRVRAIILTLAVVLTVVMNADTFMIVNVLWNDASMRNTIVANAGAAVENASISDTSAATERIQFASAQLNELQLFGWSPSTIVADKVPDDIIGWLRKLLGLFLTAVAVTLGAPFWFDILGKLINLRSSGKVPPTLQETNNESSGSLTSGRA